MIKELWNKLIGKKEKIEPPDQRGIIKINDIAKENGIYDDENKIIDLHRYGRFDILKYSDSDVQSLREQGIPVLEEEYSDEYDWLDLDSGGGIEYKK